MAEGRLGTDGRVVAERVVVNPAPQKAPTAVLGIAFLAGCCGIRELKELVLFKGAPEKAMASFAEQCYTPDGDYPHGRSNFRYVIFSEARQHGYGREFATFIRANRFGGVVETGVHVNPNSGNELKVWLWTVAHNQVRTWASINNIKGVCPYTDGLQREAE